MDTDSEVIRYRALQKSRVYSTFALISTLIAFFGAFVNAKYGVWLLGSVPFLVAAAQEEKRRALKCELTAQIDELKNRVLLMEADRRATDK